MNALLALFLVVLMIPSACAQAPVAARKYQRPLTAAAHYAWGLDAPIPVFGGQIHQESAWNEKAKSAAGAMGLAQFTPDTAEWISGQHPGLADNQPFNPSWALLALVRYDKYLWDGTDGATACDRLAFALMGYNGGAGWTTRDRALAKSKGLDDGRYWGNVEKVNAGRSASNWTENHRYPTRILRELQPNYTTWGRLTPCSS